ncbi:unnamed protein product [Caenorhabditis brenneri]
MLAKALLYTEKGWDIHANALSGSIRFEVRRSVLAYPVYRTYEFVYQIILINRNHLKRKLVIRGVGKVKDCGTFSSENIYNRHPIPIYNQFNFQAFVYAIIDENGLRKLNFDKRDVYGKSATVLSIGQNFHVPIQFINLRAPILAKLIKNQKQVARLYHRVEEFLQVFYGVHVQPKEEGIKTLLEFASEFQVLNVKRYCEQQLIRREDLKVSEKRMFKMACKFNLNILMNQVLRNVKTLKKLAKLASIAMEMESMDTNISKLLIASMYKVS